MNGRISSLSASHKRNLAGAPSAILPTDDAARRSGQWCDAGLGIQGRRVWLELYAHWRRHVWRLKTSRRVGLLRYKIFCFSSRVNLFPYYSESVTTALQMRSLTLDNYMPSDIVQSHWELRRSEQSRLTFHSDHFRQQSPCTMHVILIVGCPSPFDGNHSKCR